MSDSTPETPDRSPEADLALIRDMMQAGRKRAGVNGEHLVWWGSLLATAFFLQYAGVKEWIPFFGKPVWVGMTVVGWAGSIYMGMKTGRSNSENNPTLTAYGSAWLAVGITMALFTIGSLAGPGTGPGTATMVSSAVIGAAFFVMACVLQLRPMLFAAFGWWAIMLYALMRTEYSKEILLLLSIASLTLILAPGLYLRRLASDKE